mgnify:CR=1 FL=1
MNFKSGIDHPGQKKTATIDKNLHNSAKFIQQHSRLSSIEDSWLATDRKNDYNAIERMVFFLMETTSDVLFAKNVT